MLGLSILQRACSYIGRGLDRLGIETLGRFSLTGGLAPSYTALPFLPHRELFRPALGDALQEHYRSLCRQMEKLNHRSACVLPDAPHY